jgi:hypothetical protein
MLTDLEQPTDATMEKTYQLVTKLRLLNVRLIETADGLACQPEQAPVEAEDLGWLRDHASIAMAAQASLDESMAAAVRNALSLHATLSTLKTNPQMESDLLRLVQAEAVRLAGEIGWNYAFALSTLLAPVASMPPTVASVEVTGPAAYTGLYL